MNKIQIIKGYCCVVKCDNYLAQHYVIAIKENIKDIKNFIAKHIYKNPKYTSWSDFIIHVNDSNDEKRNTKINRMLDIREVTIEKKLVAKSKNQYAILEDFANTYALRELIYPNIESL